MQSSACAIFCRWRTEDCRQTFLPEKLFLYSYFTLMMQLALPLFLSYTMVDRTVWLGRAHFFYLWNNNKFDFLYFIDFVCLLSVLFCLFICIFGFCLFQRQIHEYEHLWRICKNEILGVTSKVRFKIDVQFLHRLGFKTI